MVLWQLWADECGSVVSAEMVAVGTVAVAGATVGLNSLSSALNEELSDLSRAIRSLDQSYSYRGYQSRHARFAGSSFSQRPVAESLESIGVGSATPTNFSPPTEPLGDVPPAPADVTEASRPVTPAEEKLPSAAAR